MIGYSNLQVPPSRPFSAAPLCYFWIHADEPAVAAEVCGGVQFWSTAQSKRLIIVILVVPAQLVSSDPAMSSKPSRR
jgi:hypothetical protein